MKRLPRLLLLLLATPLLWADTYTGKCVGVTDGDTISVMKAGKAVKIRLEGIDCPEQGQDYGTKAKQFVSALVFGKEVEIREYYPDQYGRMAARVLVAGQDVSLELVKAGLAWYFKRYSSDPVLAAAEVRLGRPRLGCGQCQVLCHRGSGGSYIGGRGSPDQPALPKWRGTRWLAF
jgi:micrococcal nuclease